MASIEKTKQYLTDFKIHPSFQRIAIMKYLFENPVHPTADEIHTSLVAVIPTLSKTTVYNTLSLLSQAGAIKELTIDEKQLHYDGYIREHAHFRCNNCGKIIDVAIDNDTLKIESLEKEHNIIITDTQVFYKGYCNECKNKFNY